MIEETRHKTDSNNNFASNKKSLVIYRKFLERFYFGSRRSKEKTETETHNSKIPVYNSIKASRQLLLFPLNHFSIWRRARLLGGLARR